MTVSHGADAERLRGVGQHLTVSAERLVDVATTGRGMAQMLAEHWSGSDLELFVGQSWPAAEETIHRSSELLRGMGETATLHADEQDGASQAHGTASTASPVTPVPAKDSGDEGAWADPGLEGPDRGSLDPEVYDAWQSMDTEERRAVLQQIVNEECARYGIVPAPEVQFEDIDGGGSWDGTTLRIDSALVDENPRGAINTAAHEARHVVQREAMDMAYPKWWQFWKSSEDMEGLNPALVDTWKQNEYDGYTGAPDEELETTDPAEYERQLKAYYDQPIETDAAAAGKRYVDDITPEELERLQEEAGG